MPGQSSGDFQYPGSNPGRGTKILQDSCHATKKILKNLDKTTVQQDAHTRLFTAALLTTAPNQGELILVSIKG